MKHIMKCPECNSYTMHEQHCNSKTMSTKPAKFSPDDKFAVYRRTAKKEILKEKDLY